MSNLGKWEKWYCMLQKDNPEAYGVSDTYQLAADWLQDCAIIEDWGSGKGWFSRFIPEEKYVGIDGSRSPFAHKVVDLVQYRSNVPGIFMRHVIEHNYEWKTLLTNALESFTERMVLVLFTPMADETHEIAYHTNPGVPDISFSKNDLVEIFEAAGVSWRSDSLPFLSGYDDETETIFYLEKRQT